MLDDARFGLRFAVDFTRSGLSFFLKYGHAIMGAVIVSDRGDGAVVVLSLRRMQEVVSRAVDTAFDVIVSIGSFAVVGAVFRSILSLPTAKAGGFWKTLVFV